MSQENLEILRQGWDAWLRGDLPGLFRTFDPDIVWDTSHFRDWPESAYHGHEGVERFLNEWLDVWDDYRLDLEDVIEVQDGRVLSLFHHHGKGRDSGVPMHLQMAQIATLRDGKVTRLDNYDTPAEALEAVGLSE
jgi:ketosteroid isomerase-like protein